MRDGVEIPIKATVDASQIGTLQGSLNALRAQLRQARADFAAAAPDSDAFRAAAAEIQRLEAEVAGLESTAGKASKQGVNFGNAMLQGSRGVQDFAAAGLPGVVNNLESLAAALGMTAGAAGGITLVAVGLELLLKNWDKLTSGFGEPEKVKAFWSAITPEEAQLDRLRRLNEMLEAQASFFERQAAARKLALEVAQQEDDALQQRARLWEGLVQTPEERGDLPPLPGMEPDTPQQRAARRELGRAQAETQARVGQFGVLDRAVQEQQRRVDDIASVASLQERIRAATAEARAEIERLSAFENEGGPVPQDVTERLSTLRRQVQEREKHLRAGVPNVPGLTDGLTGDAAKDEETLAQRAQAERARLAELSQQRFAAARAAEEAARAQALAEQGAQAQDAMATEQRAAQAMRAQGDAALPPPPGMFAGADERAGITEALERLRERQQQAAQAANQVVGAIENVQADGSQLQQRMASAFSSVAQAYRAMRQDLESFRAEFESYRESNRPR